MKQIRDSLHREFSARIHFPGSVLARFLELRGRRIVRDCGATWYTGPGRFLMSLPYQAMLNPDPAELRRMIRETGASGSALSLRQLDADYKAVFTCCGPGNTTSSRCTPNTERESTAVWNASM